MIRVDVTAAAVVCMEESTVQVGVLQICKTVYCKSPFAPMYSIECMCQNGGTCSGSVCICPPGYTGTLCETPCPSSCPIGYYLNNCSCGRSCVYYKCYKCTCGCRIHNAQELRVLE